MPRVQLEFPGNPLFTVNFPVRITDINYAGHMGMHVVLGIAHDVRLQYFQSLGYKNELIVGDHIGIVTADAEVAFKEEVFFEDLLQIELAIDGHNKYGFDIYYQIKKQKTGKTALLVKTGIVFFDIKERKVAPIPESFLEKIT